MKNLIRYIVSSAYRPLLLKYLSKNRMYNYEGIRLEIPSEVFHPKYFYSTKLLLQYINGLHISQKKLLELGAGSGLIAMYAAQKGACVTASDINPVAIEYLYRNQKANKSDIRIIHSDLFEKIPSEVFDIIMINPPYFKKHPTNFKECAWYCGENGEYFQNLFKSLSNHVHSESKVFMSLSDGCDLGMIRFLAGQRGFLMKPVCERKNLLEVNYIFQVYHMPINN